jgi:Ca2+-binding RTX toxin-like protein
MAIANQNADNANTSLHNTKRLINMSAITINDIENVKYSGDITIDALLDDGTNWNYLTPARTILYYTFDTMNFSDDQIKTPVSPFNSAQQNAAQAILNYVKSITGINFQKTTSNQQADIYFANTNLDGDSTSGMNTSDYNYVTSSRNPTVLTEYVASSRVYLDNVEWKDENSKPTAGTQGYETLLHEIGHMLGLKHPFDAPKKLATDQDNTDNTVMSYTEKGDFKTEFQAYDLKALKWIYGTDGLGGESNNVSPATENPIDETLIDEIEIEDLHLVGTPKADKLEGDVGNDTLDGAAGRDTLIGGDGDDLYIVDNVGDKLVEHDNEDNDSVESSVNFTLPKNVENLTLTGKATNGTGNALANTLIGNEKNNTLNGSAGDDTLNGGKGNDRLTGGAGSDTFMFDFADYDFMGDFAPRAVNVDTITHFKKGIDVIALSEDFTTNGFISVTNIKKVITDAGLIYDQATRTLFFDADGSDTDYTPTAMIKFSGKLNLDANDFATM